MVSHCVALGRCLSFPLCIKGMVFTYLAGVFVARIRCCVQSSGKITSGL